jgi:ribosomal protein S18 acetylase RimI-like enzyme
VPGIGIRRAVPGDRDALYDICVRTGDNGGDARPLYSNHELLGEIWVGPYLALQPDLAFVAEDGDGVVGYVLGAGDTSAFEAACEQRWWPALRARYTDPPGGAALTADERLIRRIHRPPATPASVVEEYPGHVHIDILPRGQGHGIGRRLMRTVFDALAALGVDGVHLGVGARNTRAIGFYRHLGFAPVGPPGDESSGLLLGIHLSEGESGY